MRVVTALGAANTLYVLHQDHLGSTSLVTSITGTVVSQQWYYPYGEVRASAGAQRIAMHQRTGDRGRRNGSPRAHPSSVFGPRSPVSPREPLHVRHDAHGPALHRPDRGERVRRAILLQRAVV
jgi:hypothetical protein